MKVLSHGSALMLLLAAGCSAPGGSDQGDAPEDRFNLAGIPTDIAERSRVDFGGAVELVGWDVEPKADARPGSSVHLRLYWRSKKRLSPGWRLVTELVAPQGEPALAQAGGARLNPSELVPGKIYLDEHDIVVPQDVSVPSLSLVVSLARDAAQVEGQEVEGLSGLRLPVLSGLTDGRNRAIVARLATGVVPGDKRGGKGARKKSEERRQPPGKAAGRPAMSALRRALPNAPSQMAPKENP
jgi:hypothetical protein